MDSIWKECYNNWGKVDYSIMTDCANCPHKSEKLKSCEEKRDMERSRREHYERQKEMTEWNAS